MVYMHRDIADVSQSFPMCWVNSVVYAVSVVA